MVLNSKRRRTEAEEAERPSNAEVPSATLLDDRTRDEKLPSADIVELPTHKNRRAFQLLAAQPIYLSGLPQSERDLIVVTAVSDESGNEYPVSRFGDPVWYFASEQKAKNKAVSAQRLPWPDDIPKALLDDVKAVLYCALRRGRNGVPWSASSVVRAAAGIANVLRHLTAIGIGNFGEVRAIHLSDYIANQRLTVTPSTVRHKLEVIALIWHFSSEVVYPLSEHPWGGRTLSNATGCNTEEDSPVGRTGKTPVIPLSVQRALFLYCEACFDEAEAVFQARDAERISPRSYALTELRDAVLYVTQVTSGMRNSESVGITNDSWRSEVRNGVTFHWVRTHEIKTGKGAVDYLVPPEALRALAILQRYAEPLQTRLADEADWLEFNLGQGVNNDSILGNGMTVVEAVDRLNHIRRIGQHLFLGLDMHRSDHLGTGSRIEVMSVGACNYQLKTLAKAAGVVWDVTNHQCRRTFAYNVANSRLGRMGLVFLKWQLKHASMSWTQLYASNPYQDFALYREMEEEQTKARIELMEGWMHADAPLSGGAGRKVMQTRAAPVRNLKDLLLHTAQAVEIRNTGHAWCLSGTKVCHGQGVYEPANCAGCSQAVIDRGQSSTWQLIHLENLRLAAIADCGPAVSQKAERAIRRSEEVLNDLRIPLPSSEQADAYYKTGTNL